MCVIAVLGSAATACDARAGAPPSAGGGAADTPMMRVVAGSMRGVAPGWCRRVGQVLIGDDRRLLEAMSAADVDLFGAFTGTLLTGLAPQAVSLTADEVFTELNHSLPQGVSVGDPTLVTADDQAGRAQVLVPVYRSAALSQREMKSVNKVAGELTTADLETLTDRAETAVSPRPCGLVAHRARHVSRACLLRLAERRCGDARAHALIFGGHQAHRQVENPGVCADEHPRLALAHPVENDVGRLRRGGVRQVLVEECGGCLLVVFTGGGGIAGDGGLDAAGMHAGHLHRMFGDDHLLIECLREAAHRELGGVVGGLTGFGQQTEQ